MSLPHEPPPAPERAGPPTANGPPSLSDRVRELSLNGRANGAPSRSSSGTWLPWLLCILLALAWAGVAIRWYRAAPAPTGTNDVVPAPGSSGAPVPPASTQSAERPTPDLDAAVLEAKGNLIPSHQISISPVDVSGRIIDLRVVEGKSFKKGDLLAALDPTAFLAEAKEAEAQLAAAKARYNEANTAWKLETDQAQAERAEAKALMAEAKLVYDTARAPQGGAVARLDIGQAARRYEASEQRVRASEFKHALVQGEARKQRIEALQKEMQAAEARLARADWRLRNCRITAPVDGIILSKKAEYGSLINPVVGGVSTSLCEMADLSKLEVELFIQEREIAKIKPGMITTIRPEAYPDRVYSGYYDRAMPIARRSDSSVPVRVRVLLKDGEQQGEYLKPEMGVYVTFRNRQVDPQVQAAVEKQEAEYRASTTIQPSPERPE
jgi:HlyD family secretion protein